MIRNVEVRVHFSLLFLLIYVILVASAQFPFVVSQSGLNPDSIYDNPFVWGGIFAVGLFLSVLLHEFGHVVVAQSMGVKVRGITLMMLGGVSEMERIPQHKYAEFKVSIVGPLVSFGIAAGLFAIKAYTTNTDIALFCYWLARVNIVLGIFNLFPAFPLDGGRAFRSLLSARYGPLRATQVTVKVAKAFAWLLGIWGLLSFNLIMVLIAVFIYSSANSELTYLLSKTILKGLRASDLSVHTAHVTENQPLETAALLMRSSRNTILPVLTSSDNPSKSPAIINLNSFKKVDRSLWPTLPVKDFMQSVPKGLEADEPLDQSLSELASFGALPLFKNGKLEGIVKYRDVDEVLALRSIDISPEQPSTDKSKDVKAA